MFEISLKESVDADTATVWQTITDLQHYSSWNPFIIRCKSTLDEGSPIILYIKLMPGFIMRKKEIIHNIHTGEVLEYGMTIPRLITSSTRYKITQTSNSTCRYETIFKMDGPLAPFVSFVLGRRLRVGFLFMTAAIKDRAQSLYTKPDVKAAA